MYSIIVFIIYNIMAAIRERVPIWWSYLSNTVQQMWDARTKNNLVLNPYDQYFWSIVPTLQKQSSKEVSIPDVKWLYDTYINQFSSNPVMSNALKEQYNWYDQFSNTARNISNIYDNFYNTTDPYYNNFSRINQWLNQDIVGKLQSWLDTAYKQYWPKWEQTQRVANYYADLANNIAAQNAAQLWDIRASAVASWANAWAIRNATNKQLLDSNTQYMNLKQKEIENYDNIYKNLNAYIDNFISKYGNSQDKYVRDTYNQLLNYKTQIGQWYLNALTWLEQAKMQYNLSRWGSWVVSPWTWSTWNTWSVDILDIIRWANWWNIDAQNYVQSDQWLQAKLTPTLVDDRWWIPYYSLPRQWYASVIEWR